MGDVTIRLGDIEVRRVEEVCGPMMRPEDWFGDFDRAAFEVELSWMAPDYYRPETNQLVSSVHTWVLRVEGKVILIDTCSGNHKPRAGWPAFHMLDQPYLERLAAAGVAPEEVDMVMCTHLHVDHIGWNTRLENGTWVPTFPNACYLMSGVEHAYYAERVGRADTLEIEVNAYNDSVLPVVEAGRHVFLEGSETLAKGLTLRPIPGHTPGQTAVALESRGARAFFSGDAFHFPLQVPLWHWRNLIDHDPDQGCETRRAILEHCVEHDTLLLPAHFPYPHGFHVKRRGEGFVIDFNRSTKG
jgi:glyoxylase-like metal-dependent hydrolase (beta-lactamase superfamily II)